MSEPLREKTVDEVRHEFLTHLWDLIDYWAGTSSLSNVSTEMEARDRLAGFAFSVLTTLDGESAALPAFIVAPYPHPEDREFCLEQGDNWYPEAPDVSSNIAGSLHELLHSLDPKAQP